MQKDINASISVLKFLDDLKEADIPIYKRKSKVFKEGYRSISILPNIFELYERCLRV